MLRSLMIAASAVALTLPLAACDDAQQTAQGQAQAQPSQPETPPSTQDQVSEAGRKLREAAKQAGEAAKEGAGALVQQGREALKDAGPIIDKAGEVAGQIGQSVQEIARRARQDFDTAVADLEKRLNEAGVRTRPDTSNPAARLSPPEQLGADTRAAARAHAAGIGPAYVGAWALNAEQCGKIDREPVENFAVITPTTIRRSEAVCNFKTVEPADGKATVEASCIGEGETDNRRITFSMPSADSLSISTGDVSIAVQFTRCHLP